MSDMFAEAGLSPLTADREQPFPRHMQYGSAIRKHRQSRSQRPIRIMSVVFYLPSRQFAAFRTFTRKCEEGTALWMVMPSSFRNRFPPSNVSIILAGVPFAATSCGTALAQPICSMRLISFLARLTSCVPRCARWLLRIVTKSWSFRGDTLPYKLLSFSFPAYLVLKLLVVPHLIVIILHYIENNVKRFLSFFKHTNSSVFCFCCRYAARGSFYTLCISL